MNWEIVIGFIAILIPAIGICVLIDKLRDRKHKKYMNDLKEGKLPEVSLEDPKNGVIEIIENGFSISFKQKKETINKIINWNHIKEIIAYKRDLFTTDLICIGFHLTGDGNLYEVHEEMLGYKKLAETIESRFEVNPKDWWSKVAFPAFETNATVIWQKENRNQQQVQGDPATISPSEQNQY